MIKIANPSFTRDEAILALDTMYFSCNGKATANSEAMIELSGLLNRLPIHPADRRQDNFRTSSGIAQQLNLFKSNCATGVRNIHVGAIFFEIAFEFEDHMDRLHEIAEAIRKNEQGFSLSPGSPLENMGFPEGSLLGHLHRAIEIRDGAKLQIGEKCSICNAIPQMYYKDCGELLQKHLIIPPTQLDYRIKYGAQFFIPVCPNCHEALHRYRPWLTKDNCGEILR